jgi:hypothetical protein
VVSCAAAELGKFFVGQMVAIAAMTILDRVEDRVRLFGPAMDRKPARRFGN